MVVINRMRWGQTVVPNAFIDRYMPAANGEYVKIYMQPAKKIRMTFTQWISHAAWKNSAVTAIISLPSKRSKNFY